MKEANLTQNPQSAILACSEPNLERELKSRSIYYKVNDASVAGSGHNALQHRHRILPSRNARVLQRISLELGASFHHGVYILSLLNLWLHDAPIVKTDRHTHISEHMKDISHIQGKWMIKTVIRLQRSLYIFIIQITSLSPLVLIQHLILCKTIQKWCVYALYSHTNHKKNAWDVYMADINDIQIAKGVTILLNP